MNLKEAFRYQNFLERIMGDACTSIRTREHCLKVMKIHKCSKANPEADDFEENVTTEEKFFSNDDVIRLMVMLVEEKKKLTEAIGAAKASIGFDIDAATSVNKYRQNLSTALNMMMRFKPSKRSEVAIGHKFNAEGNQVDYKYDVDVTSSDAYDRCKAKAIMRSAILESDKTSAEIDAAKINTRVEYTPIFDVNDSFDDVMTALISTLS